MDVREKLVELLKSVLPNFRNNMAYWGEKPIYEFADCLLANGVTVQSERMVDAVEIVRCKDCKHYKLQKKSAHWENRANYCDRIVTIKVQPYDFCSYGERKDGDGNG